MKQDTQKSIFRSRRSLKKEIETLNQLLAESKDREKVWENRYDEVLAYRYQEGNDYKKGVKELQKKVRDIICSNYWANDITEYMKKELFGANGKITKAFFEAFRGYDL